MHVAAPVGDAARRRGSARTQSGGVQVLAATLTAMTTATRMPAARQMLSLGLTNTTRIMGAGLAGVPHVLRPQHHHHPARGLVLAGDPVHGDAATDPELGPSAQRVV